MDLDALKGASASVSEGVWVDAKTLPGVRLHVLASTAPAASRAFRRYARTWPDKDEKGFLTEKAEANIEARVLAEVILIGWEGITVKGKPLEYSPESAAELIKVELVREAVTRAAEQAALDQAKTVLALEKN